MQITLEQKVEIVKTETTYFMYFDVAEGNRAKSTFKTLYLFTSNSKYPNQRRKVKAQDTFLYQVYSLCVHYVSNYKKYLRPSWWQIQYYLPVVHQF